ncbi:MAG: hypothetical protein ACTTJV_05895 [Ottowia sp.]
MDKLPFPAPEESKIPIAIQPAHPWARRVAGFRQSWEGSMAGEGGEGGFQAGRFSRNIHLQDFAHQFSKPPAAPANAS